MSSSYAVRSLNGWLRYLRSRSVDEVTVGLVLGARSAVAEEGLTYPELPWLLEVDRLLLDKAETVVAAAPAGLRNGFEGAPPPTDHWWWYLDEIAAGTRPRPEVG